MTILPLIVQNNFKVSGSYEPLTYQKYVNTSLPPVKLFISNSSNTFGIRFFPTGSALYPNTQLTLRKADGTPINKNYPVTLPPNTGSNVNFIELFVNLNTSEFDNLSQGPLTFPLTFNIVAITSSIVVTGAGPEFGPVAGPFPRPTPPPPPTDGRTAVPRPTVPPPSPTPPPRDETRFPPGSPCLSGAQCDSGICVEFDSGGSLDGICG